ncbi:tRNA (cytidine/uridine-2'-O)-ribose methyltransferase [Gammaproteobacteria bacterium]
MYHIILFQPQIPPNTGNIIRLCANTGAHLHLIEPLGFDLDDKHLRRAGLDYHELALIKQYKNLEEFMFLQKTTRIFACSTKGKTNYAQIAFQRNDAFLFGPETSGLPVEVLKQFTVDKILHIPMVPHSRSLNLSNTVAIVLYEAWRQNNFLS